MDEYQHIGIRLRKSQYEKTKALASALGVSRNKLWGMLVDAARIETRPSVAAVFHPESAPEEDGGSE